MKRKDFGIQYKSNIDGSAVDLFVNVQRDPNGKILSGLVLGPTLAQNITCILIAEPGDFKENLSLGVGIRSALLDEEMLDYRHKIKEQFPLDGLSVKHLDLYNLKTFSIDAEYES